MPSRTLPPYANGKIPDAKLTRIPGGWLWDPAGDAWNDLVDHVEAKEGKAAAASLRAGGPDSSFRRYDRQVYWKNYWTARGEPHKAATPGTSNHGYGIAVDCPSALGQKMLRKYGHHFGWSNYEGAAVGEPWHWTYTGPANYKRKTPKRPILLTKTEKFHVNRLGSERKVAARHGGWNKVGPGHLKNAEASKRWLREHATAYSMAKVKDKTYQDRKVDYLRDVALNRDGRG